MLKIQMPHKDPDDHKRKRGKDKQYERFQKNGLFSQKHIRITESIKEKNSIKNSNISN